MGPNGWQSSRLGRVAELLLEQPDAFCPHQYENPHNPDAYEDLADELTRDLDKIDVFVASVGSGGSLSGAARALRKVNPALKVVAVDAVGSVVFKQPDIPDRLQGGHGNSVVPLNMDHSLVDEVHWVSDAECFDMTLRLARNEKIFAGNSSGCVYGVMEWRAMNHVGDGAIVGVFPDRGDRYFHTVYSPQFRAAKGLDDKPISAAPKLVNYGDAVSSWSRATLKRI